MKLTDEQVEKFRRAYQEDYGEEMPAEEARMWAVRLVRLYRVLLTPRPTDVSERLAKADTRGTLNDTSPAVDRPNQLPLAI